MLREEVAFADPNHNEAPIWPVLSRERHDSHQPVPTAADTEPFQPAPAAPDVPAAVGAVMALVYLALIGALALATAGPGQSGMALVIAGLFVAIFFTVPWLIFKQEVTSSKRTVMSRFLAQGMQTYTGRCSGKAALVQMFIVPVLLTFGVLLIAAEIALLG